MFVTGKPFQPSPMFASDAKAYSSGVPERGFLLGYVLGLTRKHSLAGKACKEQTLISVWLLILHTFLFVMQFIYLTDLLEIFVTYGR
jgi:hypothetical protein